MRPIRVAIASLSIPLLLGAVSSTRSADQPPLTEAPAGFDSETNGFTDATTFESDKEVFEERELEEDGLGPVYNAQACVECHQSPVTGGVSQVTELRAGRLDFLGRFIEADGGSLINDRSIHADLQERPPSNTTIHAVRASLNALGDGFVEAVSNETFLKIAADQRRETFGTIRGEIVWVPVLESPGTKSVGRFGWKNQHASLVSFSADAYLNEMGITTPLQPNENTSLGRDIGFYDKVDDPEDDGEDVEIFARFMRATKAPPRDEKLAATAEAKSGSQIFDRIGCAHCHVRTIATAPAGTVLHSGFTVPEALGSKLIHPFSDFLLHDVGTGDGIVQNGPTSTVNKLRTAPLWGLRSRSRLMHDAASMTLNDAILRHRGEAFFVTSNYRFLSWSHRRELLAFLASL